MIQQITPILTVETIEPSLPFWERLGFEAVATVPHGDHLGFAMLSDGTSTVMYQTAASVRDDLGDRAQGLGEAAILYLSVGSLADVEPRISEAEVVVPKRTTDYGATEIFVREPGGHLVGFAEHHE